MEEGCPFKGDAWAEDEKRGGLDMVISDFAAECFKCGKCCNGELSRAEMSPAEAEALGAHAMKPSIRGGCRFLGDGADGWKCLVYERRPVDCRTYPVNLVRDPVSGKVGLHVDTRCPAIQKGMVGYDYVRWAGVEWGKVEDQEWLRMYVDLEVGATHWQSVSDYLYGIGVGREKGG
jgi:Fe-S-cluster containining protein